MTRLESLTYFIPELVLSSSILFLFFAEWFTPKGKKLLAFASISILGLLGMIAAIFVMQDFPPTSFFYGMLAFDPVATFVKILFPLSAILIVLFSYSSREMEKIDASSYHILLLTLTLGMVLLASSTNVLMLYLSLEMVSITSYLLAGALKGSRRSSEAALKYVIYGGVASGIMLYGLSILYGLSGTLNLHEMYSFFVASGTSEGTLILGLVLTLAGFAYKIAAFPFHMWAPDVYEGAPIPVAAYFSVGPKAAGMIALVRFFITAFANKWPQPFTEIHLSGWVWVIILLSIATMTFGNFAALYQKNLKRLLAYSSIAHAGYMLMGFVAMNGEAIEAILFYLVVYFIMNLGAFLVVLIIHNKLGVEDLEHYKGIGRRGGSGAFLGILMGIFMLSLTGLPPFAGFVGKLYIFGAVIKSGMYWLAVIGVLNSVVSLYYYVKVLKVMFFEESSVTEPFPFAGWNHTITVSLLAGLTLIFGLFWNPLAQWVSQSSGMYF